VLKASALFRNLGHPKMPQCFTDRRKCFTGSGYGYTGHNVPFNQGNPQVNQMPGADRAGKLVPFMILQLRALIHPAGTAVKAGDTGVF